MTPEEQHLYSEGRRHFEQGQWDDAARCFQSLVSGWPNFFPDIYNKMGVIFCHRGDPEGAVNYLERALTINPNYTDAALNLVIAYNELGRYEEAEQVFNNAVKIVHSGPQRMDPYVEGKLANEHANLGDQYFSLNRFQEAITEYKKAVGLRPRFIDIMTRMGMAYREMGDLEMATKTFQKVLKINPGYIQAKTHLGIAYYMKGFVDMAITEWEQALKIDPHSRDLQIYLSLLKKSPQ